MHDDFHSFHWKSQHEYRDFTHAGIEGGNGDALIPLGFNKFKTGYAVIMNNNNNNNNNSMSRYSVPLQCSSICLLFS